MISLRPDGTAECEECALPLFPVALGGPTVSLECANRHHASAPVPEDRALRRIVDGWIAKRGAQLHAQHERWESENAEEDD